MAVVPSAWNRLPLLMALTRKWVTSVPSVGWRSTTIRPDWVSSTVVVSATTGVSPTGITSTSIVSMVIRAPPVPVLPRSLVVTVMSVRPQKFSFGTNERPSSAALICAIVPVKVMLASAAPSPAPKLSAPPLR